MEKDVKQKGQVVIAFIWDFTVEPLTLYGWADGLNMALKLLASKYDWFVKVIADDNPKEIYKQIEESSPDFILGWGSLDRPSFAGIREFGVPTGLCFAGGPTEHPQLDNFDVVFVESEVYEDAFKKQGVNVHRAFGTNDYLFKPLPLKKKYLGFYPATFANWKRHNLFAKALGKQGVAAGRILEKEEHNLQVCIAEGVTVLPELPYHVMPFLFNQSKHTVVTASSIGGGQRAVIESMSCGVWPIVMADSEKCAEYVKDSGFGSIVEPSVEAIKEEIERLSKFEVVSQVGVDYIKNKYSADKYAEALAEQISTFLK